MLLEKVALWHVCVCVCVSCSSVSKMKGVLEFIRTGTLMAQHRVCVCQRERDRRGGEEGERATSGSVDELVIPAYLSLPPLS